MWRFLFLDPFKAQRTVLALGLRWTHVKDAECSCLLGGACCSFISCTFAPTSAPADLWRVFVNHEAKRFHSLL